MPKRDLSVGKCIFFVLSITLLFLLLSNTVASDVSGVYQTSNKKPVITVSFKEKVKILDYSLVDENLNHYSVSLVSNENNKTFSFQPTQDLDEGLYSFRVNYSDFYFEELKNFTQVFFRVNLSIPTPPLSLSFHSVDSFYADQSAYYSVVANYDGYSIDITDSDLLSVTSNDTSILQVNKQQHRLVGVDSGEVTVTADYLGVSTEKQITLLEPPFIKMIIPRNNGSEAYANSTHTLIEIRTFRQARCKWSTITEDPVFMLDFNYSDGFIHGINDFRIDFQGENFYIYCNESNGEEHTKTFKFYFVSEAPKITLIDAPDVYNKDSDGKFRNRVLVVTDKDAVCKYDEEDVPFNEMLHYFKNGNFNIEDSKLYGTYSKNHRELFENLQDQHIYKYYVSCMGLSGLMSKTASFDFEVNTLAEPKIEVLSPARYLNSRSVLFKLRTNKYAQCFFANTSDFSNRIAMDSSNALIHNYTKIFTIGTHNAYFLCLFYGGTSINKKITFTIDTTPPSIYYVNDSTNYDDPEQTGSTSELRFKVDAEDNESGISKIIYSLWQNSTNESEEPEKVLDWTTVNFVKSWIRVRNLELENNTHYFFKVKVVNGAGLNSEVVESDGVLVNKSQQPPIDLCNNYVFNPENNETDVDCGGPCSPCTYGKNCKNDSDCLTGYCNSLGKCDFRKNESNHCKNGKKDEDETDVDCGGSCEPCSEGDSCERNRDCESGLKCIGGECKKQVCDRSVDEDCDSVEDDFDVCPDTPEGEVVDENGCSESQLEEKDKNKEKAKDNDKDNDGMDDDWELEHDLDPTDPYDAEEDPDHDDLTNLQEFNEGTDPHKPDNPYAKKKGGFPILLLLLLLLLVGGLVGFLLYSQMKKSKKSAKLVKKPPELGKVGVKSKEQISTSAEPLTALKKKSGSKQIQVPNYKQTPQLTPEQIAKIRERARLAEKKRIFEEFEQKHEKQKKHKETTHKQGTHEQESIIKSKTSTPEHGILEIEIPEELGKKKSLSSLEEEDVFKRLEKLGERVKGKNIDEELKKLTKGKKNVYSRLEKLIREKKLSGKKTKKSKKK